jgi:hypothetical protein
VNTAVAQSPEQLGQRADHLLASEGWQGQERQRLVRLVRLLAGLPPPPDPLGLYPRWGELRDRLDRRAAADDGLAFEEAFLELYAHLHGHQAPYTRQERARMDETGGYWCHAGGLSPILKAGPHIQPHTVSADLGAGNGLQCLLLQALDPHRLSIQIEISSRMVAAGKALQRWLGVPQQRMRWIVGDVLDADIRGVDFVYLYRPVRPDGEGRRFYQRLAAQLQAAPNPVVVFSIADCLTCLRRTTPH